MANNVIKTVKLTVSVVIFLGYSLSTMAVSTQMSLLISVISTVLIFSGMQMYKHWFLSMQVNHIIGGYLGSLLFTFAFTALCNLETCVFGKGFQAKLFPEVFVSILLALFATGTIHRVCVTTCVLFSGVSLYYINNASQKVFVSQPITNVSNTSIKKRK